LQTSVGPVTETVRNGASELLSQNTTGTVPSTTSAVVVELTMTRYVGSDDDGMADDLSLTFSDK